MKRQDDEPYRTVDNLGGIDYFKYKTGEIQHFKAFGAALGPAALGWLQVLFCCWRCLHLTRGLLLSFSSHASMLQANGVLKGECALRER